MPKGFARRDGLNSPAQRGFAITPGATELTEWARMLYIGTAGNVHVQTVGDDDILFTAVPVGILNVSVKKVYSDTTTALNIIGLY